MLSKLLIRLFAAASLLAVTAPAAPVADAAVLPAELAPRQGTCPTTTLYASYSYTTLVLSTTTITDGVSSLGHVTSTKTESETITVNTISTVYYPAVVTSPTLTTSPTVAVVTTTIPYWWTTTTITSPGYAPSSLCEVTTYSDNVGGTTTVTVTDELSFATVWTYQTGHVTTTTKSFFTTSTRTFTTPGSTTYATTVTAPQTMTSVAITTGTSSVTVWAQGCQTYACQA